MTVTEQILRAWVDSVLKPMLTRGVRAGIPLDALGSALIGYGVSVCRTGAGMTSEQIRAALETAIEAVKPD